MFAKSGKMLRYKAEISQTGKHVRAPSLGLFVARKNPPQLPDSWQLNFDPACYISM